MERNRLLGEFLRARREATPVEQVGLARVGHRRTPGLRREEVAILAGISTDYYSRLEQGRERNPSDQVLVAIARVMCLEAEAVEYLHALAHPLPKVYRVVDHREEAAPTLLRVLRGWTHTPGFIIDRWMNMLATNRLADALYAGMEHNDNLIRLVFLNPEALQFYADWEKTAYLKAAHLRGVAAMDPHDPLLPRFVQELSAHNEEFRRLRGQHDLRPRTNDTKRFRHRLAGELAFEYDFYTAKSAPGQQLVLMQVGPDSAAEQGLAALCALADSGVNVIRLAPAPEPVPFGKTVVSDRG
ncbi:helix-turn-helix domain-containing protein [Microbispora cellulosiformans]|uniref:Helix-turn-helix domain-containing protein n=1 Tax=Microbispora cellulosiformans TaxID=2614688 RepID=A0A5J5JWK4_9ACTN|nr:helix-turn-helix transcriptional regulator [Microbispora cellulosiformans]KAA9374987.1 helix-turn-helix domain-containing protein [Microbispora cellulosiformans]